MNEKRAVNVYLLHELSTDLQTSRLRKASETFPPLSHQIKKNKLQNFLPPLSSVAQVLLIEFLKTYDDQLASDTECLVATLLNTRKGSDAFKHAHA